MILKYLGPVLVAAGVIAGAIGGVALLARPAAVVLPHGDLGTPVAVIPPNVLALDGLGEITITAEGAFDVRTARPADAYAWVALIDTSVVRGLETWDEIRVDRAGTATGRVPAFPGDIWRDWGYAYESTTITAASIEPGLAVVLVSRFESSLGTVTFEMTRDRGNGWAWPAIAGGLGGIVAGLGCVVAWMVATRLKGREEVA